jgi:hypothetical protein
MPRLPRFRRIQPTTPWRLTDRDCEIIRVVYRHRFLRSSQIIALLGGSRQQLLRRLKPLYHHGYLERPRAQLDTYYKSGSREIVYGLGNKGGTLLKQEPGKSFRKLSWGEKNRAVGRIFLEHALLVSDVMVSIELACRENGVVRLLTEKDFTPPTEHERQHLFRWWVNVNGGLKLGVIPDCTFALEFQKPDGSINRTHFFLEADRGTMPVKRAKFTQTSVYRKLLAYEATWSQGIHRTRFGFQRFRVLTVTKSLKRIEALVDVCSELKRGHGLFLFADKSILNKSHDILSTALQTGKAGEVSTLLS